MTLELHPLCGLVPAMSEGEFAALVDDIRANGLREPIWLYEGKIIDGRHRYRACLQLGIPCPTREFLGKDAQSFVVSMNVHRRHLSHAQRREFVAMLLKREPRRSNRQIARATGVNDVTVGRVRKDMESRAEILHVERIVGQDGKEYPARGLEPAEKEANDSLPTPPRHRSVGAPEKMLAYIREMLGRGYNVEQIATHSGRNPDAIRDFIGRRKLGSAVQRRSTNGTISPARVIGEMVSAIAGAAHGVRLINTDGPHDITAAAARDMLDDLAAATPSINRVRTLLKRIVHEHAS